MDNTSKQIILANYGKLKLARYLVRSFDDLVDVCQTVARQVVHCAEADHIFKLFNAIDCSCSEVPNTLSSVILGFQVPEKILHRKGYRARPSPIPELRVPPTLAPKYGAVNGGTVFSLEITCFLDLYLLHRFIREAMNLTGEGMKLITSKRSARLQIGKTKSNPNGFRLKITFPCDCDLETLVQLETRFLRQALTGS